MEPSNPKSGKLWKLLRVALLGGGQKFFSWEVALLVALLPPSGNFLGVGWYPSAYYSIARSNWK